MIWTIGKFSTSHRPLTMAEGIYYPRPLTLRYTEAIHGITICTHISLGTKNNRYVSVCECPRVISVYLWVYETLTSKNKFLPGKQKFMAKIEPGMRNLFSLSALANVDSFAYITIKNMHVNVFSQFM